MTTWLGLVLLVAVVALFVRWAIAHAGRINDYFRAAVELYAFTGDQRARLVALTAAKVAAGKQRASMVRYLRAMAKDMGAEPAAERVGAEIQERLTGLERHILSRDWTTADVAAGKADLAAVAPEYLAALDRADPAVFRRTRAAPSSSTSDHAPEENQTLQELAKGAECLGVSLKELAAAPARAMEIVGAYGRLLEDAPAQVRPESTLPYPKQVIREALKTALSTLSDAESRRALQTGLSELDAFVPDHEVPQDPNERALEYIRRRSLWARTRSTS